MEIAPLPTYSIQKSIESMIMPKRFILYNEYNDCLIRFVFDI